MDLKVGFSARTSAKECVETENALRTDYLAIGSDSGRIVILEYDPNKDYFKRVHMETFGKTGCRRIVPGQYIASDPKGRAIMIGKL